MGLDADEFGQRTIDAQNISGLVVSDDEIGNGVEDLNPVAIGLLHAGEEAGVFEGDASLSGDGLEQLAVFLGQRLGAIYQAQRAEDLLFAALETGENDVIP